MVKVHGGVRYLEKAVFNLDYGQLKLVFEAPARAQAAAGERPAPHQRAAHHDGGFAVSIIASPSRTTCTPAT